MTKTASSTSGGGSGVYQMLGSSDFCKQLAANGGKTGTKSSTTKVVKTHTNSGRVKQ